MPAANHNRYHDRIAYKLVRSRRLNRSETAGAALAGLRGAAGVPMLLTAGGMAGFGALAHDTGFSGWQAVLATVAVWALPAQVVAAEMHAAGADLLAIAVAAALTSMRFFPMAVALLPSFGRPPAGMAGRLLQAHLMSATSWAFMMRPAVPTAPRLRLAYHTGFTLGCISVAAVATFAGYHGAAGLPGPLALGLLFLNAAFFMVLLADSRSRQALLAVALGAVLCVPIHAVLPEASLVLSGVIGGSVAFVLGDRWRPRS